MADLLALDDRIEEGRREQRCILVATFADVRHFMEDFVELYPAAAPLAGAAWDDVRSLAWIEPLDPWDLGRTLYVLHTSFFVGSFTRRSQAEGHTDAAYCPVRQVLDFPRLLIGRLDACAPLERSGLLSRLRSACLPWPAGDAPCYSHPMRYLSHLTSVTARWRPGTSENPPTSPDH